MIDLHTHTNASDGTLSPEALIDLAADKGLQAIAITDHDTVGGIPAALERGKQRGVIVIPGVELGARWDDAGQLHILGYYIDHRHPYLLERLSWLRVRRRDRCEEIVQRLRAAGATISWDRVAQLAGAGSVGRPHVARALIEAGQVQSISEAFHRYLNPGTPGFLEKIQFTSRQAIELIDASGGTAVLAHPATLKLQRGGLEACIEGLINEGLRGIEVYWSKHTEAEVSYYQELASRFGLIMTGGSDFHGANKPTIELSAGLNRQLAEASVLLALKTRTTRACVRTV
jgi:predicted metal-dependent phosphoesterase TrpH